MRTLTAKGVPADGWPQPAPGFATFAACLGTWPVAVRAWADHASRTPEGVAGTAAASRWDLAFFLETGSPERLLSLSLDGLALAVDAKRGGTVLGLTPDGTAFLEVSAYTWPVDDLRVTGLVRFAQGSSAPFVWGVRVAPKAAVSGRFERSFSLSRLWTPGGMVETGLTLRAGLRQRDALLRIGARLRLRQGLDPAPALASRLPAWMLPDPGAISSLLSSGLELATRMRPWEVARRRATLCSGCSLRSPSPPVTMAG